MLRQIFAFSAIALITAACSSENSLGSGDGNLNGVGGAGGTGGGATWDPCGGKVCGAECSLCAPNDPECAETAVLKFCDEKGQCGQAYPACSSSQCTTDSDCPSIGAPCQQCPDGSYACPWTKCEAGQCVGGFDACQGQQCKADSDCPSMGAPCQPCPDGSFACPWTKCDNGFCAGGFDGCAGYDPCANKACGDACTLCPPNDPNCAETTVLKFCDGKGQCGPSVPSCGGAQCKSDMDCPAIEICKPCADGSCALVSCLNGTCGWTCPPPPNPECKSAADCGPAPAICKICGDGTCAVTDCVNGSCELVCKL